MSKKITILNSEDKQYEADLLLSFEVPEIDEKYIIYSYPSNKEDVVINVGNLKKSDDDKYYIKDLDNEEEWNFVKKVMLQIVREEK